MGLKIALVGTGRVAERSYLPALVQHGDVQLLYYNRTRAKAEHVAQQFGGRVAGSMQELMAEDPDAVLVLTDETQRYAAASALLEFRPRRVFFEKPLVAQQGQSNVVEEDFLLARELLQRAQAAGTETAMVFNYRFFDQSQRARGLIAERNLGAALHATGLVHYACWSHCIDLLLDLVGPVAEISALSSSRALPMGESAAVSVTAAFHTESDATGTLIGTHGLSFDLPLFELTLAYERGRLHMRDLDGDLELLDYARGYHEVYAPTRNTSRWEHYNASFARSVAAYLDSIRAGTPPPIPGIAGLRELQFEAALKRSVATGCSVELARDFPLGGL